MKTHSRVQYTATIGDRVRTSAQARTIKGWMYQHAVSTAGRETMFGVDVRNIHTGASTKVYVRVSVDTPEAESMATLLNAKEAVGA